MKRHTFLQAVLILLLTVPVFAQKSVAFYATVSESDDSNMIAMTTDLFFSQLQGLEGYSVVDRRDITFTPETTYDNDIAFYAEIQEKDGGWACTLNAFTKGDAKDSSLTKIYASYYKILLDAKASLESLLASLEDKPQENGSTEALNEAPVSATLDTLAGTWTGEQLIDKIIILRGGKGFVIFKNGASMNITVTLKGSSVLITQKGRSNASFFPELSRELALKNAANAEPISWNMTMTGQQSMKGTKTTLVEDEESETGIAKGTFEVEWKRQ
ncbi:MAG: hypothetical protein J5930_10840 [Treponema sp.]|nr:hypothetical protein [Treponema sp.]